MKSVATCAVLTVMLVLAGAARAEETEHSGRLPREVLAEIRQSQGVSSDGKIDCDKVTVEQYEELGEALMEQSFADPEDHEWMDEMMGGDDSPNVRAMHRMMGARYLGCSFGGRAGRYFGGTGYGMMGGGMGSGMMGGYGSMHDWDDYSTSGRSTGWLWLLIIAAVVVVLFAVVLLIVVRALLARPAVESPLDVLKRRYAGGEVTKEEYDRLRGELK